MEKIVYQVALFLNQEVKHIFPVIRQKFILLIVYRQMVALII